MKRALVGATLLVLVGCIGGDPHGGTGRTPGDGPRDGQKDPRVVIGVEAPGVGDPVDAPPTDEPPVDEPPVDEPPVDEPPVDEPPVDEPPVDEPPVDEPPALPPGAEALCDPISLEDDVDLDGFRVDRFHWLDAACEPRTAALVHNDRVDPTGHRGGYLRELTYETPDGTRTVSSGNDSHPGFGYTVNHFGGSSASSRRSSGTFSRLFTGPHHAFFQYRWTFPIDGHDVDVTVRWMFASGRDHPLWSVTFDTSGAPPDAIEADTRAPYGDLLFDGNLDLPVDGVGWGDRYKFETTSSPVTPSTGWTYDRANLVPYVVEWSDTADAEMGVVQTQTWMQHDAGGYWLYSSWGDTSSGPMPESWNWTYQLNQYELPFTTRSHRMAWGSNYGAVGQQSYPAYGDDRTLSGYPYQSYSTFIVLGLRSADTVAGQVQQMETLTAASLACTTGQVAARAEGGVGRTDEVDLDPAGYDAVNAAFAVDAAGDEADCTLDLGDGVVVAPLLRIRGYTGSEPPAVQVDGAPAAAYVSLDDDRDEVWVTLPGAHTGAVQWAARSD